MWCETRGQDEGQGHGTLAEDFVGFFWGFLKPLGTLDTAKMEHFRDSNSFELHQFWETPNFSKLTFCFPEFSWREICPGKYHPQRSCHFGALIAPPSYLLLVDEGYAIGCHQYYFIFDINVVNHGKPSNKPSNPQNLWQSFQISWSVPFYFRFF